MTFRTTALSALIAATTAFPGLAAGLDPATQARLAADKEAIRQADASRRSVLLTRGTDQGERNRALEDFRDRRRKAVLDAVEALLAVRATVPKEEWKAIVAQVGAGGGMPFLAGKAQKELPAVVLDPARLASADKTLADLAAALKKQGADPNSAGQRFLSLLEKKNSTKDDFITAMEKLTAAQEKLDQRVTDGISNLQRTLTPEEWDELVRRLAAP
ncbi:MAG TPA: hypothetical protein PLB01_14115 [Thermoanaerobaculia bacterium]|nr:hypothetical protein [Thermoanaerobaculia bacterium]